MTEMFNDKINVSKVPGTPFKPNFNYSFTTYLGIEMIEVTADRVIGDMTVKPELMQPWGVLHGGAIAGLADSMCGIACAANLDHTKEFFLTVEFKMNFIRSIKDGTVRATATPIQRGRQVHIWECKVLDPNEKLIAAFWATQLIQQFNAK